MFGIDLGIRLSSVYIVGGNKKPLDCSIIFGEPQIPEEWTRIVGMSDSIVNTVDDLCRRHTSQYPIMQYVAIEEPIYSYKVRNPRIHFQLSCLYALVRNKLAKRGFDIYSVNPQSVKSTARNKAFRGKNLKKKYYSGRSLTKKGMVLAFKKLNGEEPQYSNAAGRETLADSFFIALTGIERKEVGVR